MLSVLLEFERLILGVSHVMSLKGHWIHKVSCQIQEKQSAQLISQIKKLALAESDTQGQAQGLLFPTK